MAKRHRYILFLAIAVVLWLAGSGLILFAEEVLFRIVGVISFAAACPVAIVGGRGLQNRQ
jgi:hypothetical protein